MKTNQTTTPAQFYAKWIAANAVAEVVGLGLSIVIGYWLFHTASPWLLFAGMVLLGIGLEGVMVGWLQWRVLRLRLPDLTRRAWVQATAVGAGIAWLLGMLPSTLIETTSSAETSMTDPSPLVVYALAVGMGLVLGPILAFAQWRVLRHHIAGAAVWIPANALAWAVGMPNIFLTASIVSDGGYGMVTSVLLVVGGLTMTGCAVGAIHGAALLSLFARRLTPVTRMA